MTTSELFRRATELREKIRRCKQGRDYIKRRRLITDLVLVSMEIDMEIEKERMEKV